MAMSVRARVVAGARAHFLRNGFRSVTMDDLAAELGMSKKTLYQQFSTKADLLKAVLQEKFSEADRDLKHFADDESLAFSERLHGMLDCLRRHTAELSPSFVRDMGKDAPDLFRWVQGRRRELIQQHWRGLFECGRKEGMIRSDLSMDVIIGALAGAADAVVNPQKLEELGMTPREAVGEIITLFIEGVATARGRRHL